MKIKHCEHYDIKITKLADYTNVKTITEILTEKGKYKTEIISVCSICLEFLEDK